jgi:hypothetical protein
MIDEPHDNLVPVCVPSPTGGAPGAQFVPDPSLLRAWGHRGRGAETVGAAGQCAVCALTCMRRERTQDFNFSETFSLMLSSPSLRRLNEIRVGLTLSRLGTTTDRTPSCRLASMRSRSQPSGTVKVRLKLP